MTLIDLKIKVISMEYCYNMKLLEIMNSPLDYWLN